MFRAFGKNIAGRLNQSAFELAEQIAFDIFDIADDKGDSPEVWPVTIPLENGLKILECPRVMMTLSDILDGYGLIVQIQQDFIMLDVVDSDAQEELSDYFGGDLDIPQAKDMQMLSKNSMQSKLTEVCDSISGQIHEIASAGEFKTTIDLVKPPISKNMALIKRICKKLAAKGYDIGEHGTKIKEGAKIDFGVTKKITISWGK